MVRSILLWSTEPYRATDHPITLSAELDPGRGLSDSTLSSERPAMQAGAGASTRTGGDSCGDQDCLPEDTGSM